jgi:hypothetical protein
MEILVVMMWSWMLFDRIVHASNPSAKSFMMLDYLVILWTLILLGSVVHGILAGRDSSDIAYESRFLLFVPVYFLYSSVIEKKTNIRFHLITLVGIAVFLIVVASITIVSTTFLVRVGGQTRLVIGEHGFYFCMMATLFFSLALHDGKRVLLYFIGFFLSIAMVVVSYQRTSYVELLVSLLLLGLLIEGKRRKYFVWSVGILATVLLPAALFWGPYFANYARAFGERTSSIRAETGDPSIIGRYIEYALSYVQIRAHPIIGTGMGTAINYILPTDFGLEPIKRIVPHNEILWMAFKNGIPSVLLFLTFVGYAVVQGRKAYMKIVEPIQKAFVLGAICTIAGILVRAQFEDTFHKHRIGFMFWALLGILAYYIREHLRAEKITTA